MEEHRSLSFGKQSVVLPTTDVQSRMELRPMLTDQDLTSLDELASEALHSQTLGIGVTTVAGTTAAFLCAIFSSQPMIWSMAMIVYRWRCPWVLR